MLSWFVGVSDIVDCCLDEYDLSVEVGVLIGRLGLLKDNLDS